MTVSMNLAVRIGYWPPHKGQLLRLALTWRKPTEDSTKQDFVLALIQGYQTGLADMGFGFLAERQKPFWEVGDDGWILFLPFHEVCEEACLFLIKAIFKRVNAASAANGKPDTDGLSDVSTDIDRRFFSLKNPKRFAQNLIPRKIPIFQRGSDIIQIGWGGNGRLMNSSVSEQTSQFGIAISSDKKLCSEILRLHGLPASNAVLCRNAAAAIAAARWIGFPVVVKPADQERGVGVFALIEDEDRLRAAFASASQVSKNVLIEKHFFGQDYRIQIYRGQAYSVTHRQPGSVTGNGSDTVEQLLIQLNEARESHPLLRKLALDDDARYMLKRQGLHLRSIPHDGQIVPLRSIANVDRGGISTQVLEHAHPDNLALAARAAEIVNLDIAGIDILIEDIRRSWKDVGALICEVNAKPMINQAALGRLVDLMQPETGYRLPAMLVVAPLSISDVMARLAGTERGIGVASVAGAWVDGVQINSARNLTQNGRSLLFNKDVRLILHITTPEHVHDPLFGGFPSDHYDRLLLWRRGEGLPSEGCSPFNLQDIIDCVPTMADQVTHFDDLNGDHPESILQTAQSWVHEQLVN
jgi:D-alanine-D-alanine ligase-like ATP-grasp enzyme